MQVSVHIVSSRQKKGASYGTYEEYDLAKLDGARLTKKATADVLRAIADDISPAPAQVLPEYVFPEAVS